MPASLAASIPLMPPPAGNLDFVVVDQITVGMDGCSAIEV